MSAFPNEKRHRGGLENQHISDRPSYALAFKLHLLAVSEDLATSPATIVMAKSPRTINLAQKLMVVMAAPATSNKLPVISGVISGAE